MFPDAKQLYAALSAVGSEALIAGGALSLPWGNLFVAGLAPMPVAPLNFNKRSTDLEVNRVDFQEYLHIEFETMPMKPISDPNFKPTDFTLAYEADRVFRNHFGGCFIQSIPRMETRSPAESVFVVICT